MRFKWIMRWSREEGRYRLGTVVWQRGTVGDGVGYSCKLSVALLSRFPFLRIKLHTSYGGIYV